MAQIARNTGGTPSPARSLMPEAPAGGGAPGAIKLGTASSTMSFVGSARRVSAWAQSRAGTEQPKAALVWTAAVLGIALMWSLVAMWYVVVWGLFGIILLPFRILTRGGRRREALQRAQLATTQAMLVQQNQTLASNQPPAPPAG